MKVTCEFLIDTKCKYHEHAHNEEVGWKGKGTTGFLHSPEISVGQEENYSNSHQVCVWR